MISDPKGLDFPIQDLQKLFQSKLFPDVSEIKKDFYPRVFLNQRSGRNIPEIYKDGEYKEVFFDDHKSVISWFDVTGTPDQYDAGHFWQEIGIVFIVNIADLFPNLTHRAIEECHLAVRQILSRRPMVFQINDLVTGKDAYGDFNPELVKHPDMQPWHVFRINGLINYQLNC